MRNFLFEHVSRANGLRYGGNNHAARIRREMCSPAQPTSRCMVACDPFLVPRTTLRHYGSKIGTRIAGKVDSIGDLLPYNSDRKQPCYTEFGVAVNKHDKTRRFRFSGKG